MSALNFPAGTNSTDTVLGGVHFNLTTLKNFDYELYGNGTVSNGSWCILTFQPYTPALLLPNGSFVNSTWCYTPINPIGTRAKTGLGFAAAFGLSLVLTLMVLRKQGRLYLPAEKRFWPIGRRWQWYWGIFVCVTALISLITDVDVDRYYIVELPIVLNVFFWFLMQTGTIAVVWEAVRHWGSWMERQFIDPDPFVLHQNDRRGRFEFWLPLFFYLWLWLNFFLVVPRNWTGIELQRSPEQTQDQAVPTATDARFKAAAMCLFICWLTIVVSLQHSIKHYLPRNRGLVNRALGLVRYIPVRFLLLLPLSLALVGYQALCAWEFQWSPLNLYGEHLPIFLGGYGPSLLILIVQLIAGVLSPNEDKELMRQRRLRGIEQDRELGIVPKPAWWRRVHSEASQGESIRERIARNVREMGGGRATARNINQGIDTRAREADEAVEMATIRPAPSGANSSRPSPTTYSGKSDRRRSERTMQAAAGTLFPIGVGAGASVSVDRRAELMMDGPPPPPYQDRGRTSGQPPGPPTALRSDSAETSVSIAAPPQQVRSMLDV